MFLSYVDGIEDDGAFEDAMETQDGNQMQGNCLTLDIGMLNLFGIWMFNVVLLNIKHFCFLVIFPSHL